MTHKEIIDICEKYSIKNYTINPDNTIDVNGSVHLYKSDLDELPLQFNKVTGYFVCGFNKLTSLKGAPKYVGGYFNCNVNFLYSLENAPTYIGIDISCIGNPIHYIYYKYIQNFNNIELFNEFKIINGNTINVKRLNDYININNYNHKLNVSLLSQVGYELI